VSRVGEARGLAAEDCLGESAVEEGIFYVELLNGPVTGDNSGEHRANSGRFYNRAESLVVVDSGALSETLKDPTGLVVRRSAGLSRDQGSDSLCDRRVDQEDTSGGSRGKLMGHGGGDVRITCTTEDAEVLVRG
jgi:hypothetical protein